jgi:hypothetical protein
MPPDYAATRGISYDLGILLLDGFAGLSSAQLPSEESLHGVAEALRAGPRRYDPVPSVISATFHAAFRLTPLQSIPFGDSIPAFRPMMAATHGAWDVVARQIEKITPAQVRGIGDFVREMGRSLVLPYLLRERDDDGTMHWLFEKARTQMGMLLASRWHVGQFLQRSADWHKALGIVIVEDGRAHCRDLEWKPWIQSVRVGDLRIVPLCSSSALQEEGVAMHHCVGGYDVECATQATQIFSIRTVDGQRLSTLQLRVHPVRNEGKFRFSIEQHHARCNGLPENEAEIAATTLITALNHGKMPHRVADALKSIGKINSHDTCGFDFRNDAAWESARNVYLPFLPADWRTLAPTDFGRLAADFKLPELRQLAKDEPDANDDDDDFEVRVLRWIR